MDIFNISDAGKFQTEALKIFRHQAKNSKVYKQFLDLLKIDPFSIVKLEDIPFIPVDFFKSHQILSTDHQVERIFSSSGTTGSIQSQHFVTDLNLYEESFSKGFEYFYGNVKDYTILALLPGYLERQGSSLIYMVDHLIKQSNSKDSGFYLNELDALSVLLTKLDSKGEKVILIGVTYALLDLIKDRKFNLKNTIVMETGGMKGKRKELIRSELHDILSDGFGGINIHSEYGMTELLSQAYSSGAGVFETPPWMKIFIRDPEDPFYVFDHGRTGGINIVDLANINSCSFIATQDLGRKIDENKFEILGRFDHSDIRGCNLMVV
jgi:hypothetical protein